ncbi:hypothetical protein DEIPH_ctg025orf0071 [Deinococcus phoenicis]|uniref:Solute-binding protein family 3/N-terminal domain-containing protein n=1 Tax=Deinococcus phoenicis TaxID=1476583 RepID=A0A016QQG1_9DEIO|nr:transporter substrate-binding domain-containing protein [Deinococcus phoenicis]EYB68226.1 hypothetical protein DEIPH_ctg025orf0071 [Deinococcus phoenicis]
MNASLPPLPFLTAALLALLAAPHAEARTLAQIKASGVLRVATTGDMPPFTVVNAGRYSGFEPELLEAVASDLGVRVSYETARGDQFVRLLQEDRVDVAVGAQGITSTRENKVDFTVPTACAGVSVASMNPGLQKHTDLVGKTIAVSAGSIMQAYVQKLPFEKKVNVYPTVNDVIFAVISRGVDATFAYTVMQPAIKKMLPKAPLSFGPELWSVPIGMMVREDNASTRLALNASLTKLMQSGSYASLSLKHFGKDVRCTS